MKKLNFLSKALSPGIGRFLFGMIPLVSLVACADNGYGADYTWTGANSDSFSDWRNWSGGAAPSATTVNSFFFGTAENHSLQLAGGNDWTFSSITFNPGADSFNIGPSSGGTVVGQRFVAVAPGWASVVQESANDQTISATIYLSQATSTLSIEGAGDGALTLSSVRIWPGGTQTFNAHRNVTFGSITAAGSSANAMLDFNVDSGKVVTFSPTVPNVAANGIGNPSTKATSVTKTGNGTLDLRTANTYSGGTLISAGTLLANNTTGSATGDGAVTLANGILGGTGTIAPKNSDISLDSGVLAVGNVDDASGSGIVSLTFQKSGGVSNFSLSSDVTVKLDIWSAANYERLVFGSNANAFDSINLNGASLVVSSTFSGWKYGDSFTLFEWGSDPLDRFGELLTLPELSNGLVWDTSELYVTGMIRVVPEPGTVALATGALILIGATQRGVRRHSRDSGAEALNRDTIKELAL